MPLCYCICCTWLRGTVVERSLTGRTFPVPRSTYSWQMTTYVGKPSAIGQPTRPTQPFIISRSINWVVTNCTAGQYGYVTLGRHLVIIVYVICMLSSLACSHNCHICISFDTSGIYITETNLNVSLLSYFCNNLSVTAVWYVLNSPRNNYLESWASCLWYAYFCHFFPKVLWMDG